MEISLTILFVGLVVFLAHLFVLLFDRTRIPDVLFLMLLGLLLGPVAKLVTPDQFGRLGEVFNALALVLILFEGGLEINFAGLRQALIPGIRLTVANFLFTTLVTFIVGVFLLKTALVDALLLGTIAAATSSAVVIPLVTKLKLADRNRTTLVLEASFSDVISIVITLGILQAMELRELQPGQLAGQLIAAFILAALLGALAAIFWSIAIQRIRNLENNAFTTLAFVFIVFGTVEFLGYSGAIAALIFGISLKNIHHLKLPALQKQQGKLGKLTDAMHLPALTRDERSFVAEFVFLIKTFFFVYIGLLVQIHNLNLLLIGALIVALLFLTRFPVVSVGLSPDASRYDASIAAVMAPRGLAAAVLAAIVGQSRSISGAQIQDVIYAVILLSIVFTSLMIFLIDMKILNPLVRRLFAAFREGDD